MPLTGSEMEVPLYVRLANGTIYRAGASGLSRAVADSLYLPLTGGTITGVLNLNPGTGVAQLYAYGYPQVIQVLESKGGPGNRYVRFRTDGVSRFQFGVDGTAESGGNAGSDFVLTAYSDAGAITSTPIRVTRSTGLVTLSGDPTAALGAATKQYVDGKIPASLPPSGAAGGDLTGTYPNPTIVPGVIVDADINSSAAIAQTKVFNLVADLASKVPTTRSVIAGNGLTGGGTLASDATLNVVSATADMTVAADSVTIVSAPKWTTGRTVALTGDVTGTSVAFDGQANLSFATAIAAGVIVDNDVSGTAAIAQAKIANLTTDLAAKVPTSRSVIAGAGLTGGGALSADVTVNVVGDSSLSVGADSISVVSAPKWTTGRTVALTGDVTGTSIAFDGTANLSFATTIAAGVIVDADVNASAAIAQSKIANLVTDLANKLPTAGGTITGNLTVNGTTNLGTTNMASANSRTYTVSANGVPSSNLGSPTLPEMALFDGQFNNKTWFHDPSLISFWKTVDGTNWESVAVGTTTIKQFVAGAGAINTPTISIPRDSQKFRIEVRSASYVYLNALYMYYSTNSHSTTVQISAKRCSDQLWYGIAASTATVSSWPGHLYLPFPTVPFHPTGTASHYDTLRIEFAPVWVTSGGYENMPISLNFMELWGGYPVGSRSIEKWDENGTKHFRAVNSANAAAAQFLRSGGATTEPTIYFMDQNYSPQAVIDSSGRYVFGSTDQLTVGDGGPVYGSSYRGVSTSSASLLLGGTSDNTTYLIGSSTVQIRPSGLAAKALNVTTSSVAADQAFTSETQPAAANHLTRKDYVDAADGLRVLKAGDTMTGTLAVPNLLMAPTVGTAKGRFGTLPGVEAWVGMFVNASFVSGQGWLLDDPTKPGWFMKVDSRNSPKPMYAIYYIPAGGGYHTDEYEVFSVDGVGAAAVRGKITAGGDIVGNYGAFVYGADMGNYKVTGVATPTNGTDAANKTYVDNNGFTRIVTIISGATTLASAKADYVYVCSAGLTATLPTAVGNTNVYTIKRTGTGDVTLAPVLSQTIDGAANFVLDVQYQSIDLVSDGSKWVVI